MRTAVPALILRPGTPATNKVVVREVVRLDTTVIFAVAGLVRVGGRT